MEHVTVSKHTQPVKIIQLLNTVQLVSMAQWTLHSWWTWYSWWTWLSVSMSQPVSTTQLMNMTQLVNKAQSVNMAHSVNLQHHHTISACETHTALYIKLPFHIWTAMETKKLNYNNTERKEMIIFFTWKLIMVLSGTLWPAQKPTLAVFEIMDKYIYHEDNDNTFGLPHLTFPAHLAGN